MGIFDSGIRKEIRETKARLDTALMCGGSDLSGDPCPSRVSGYEKQLDRLNGQLGSMKGGPLAEGFFGDAMRTLEKK